MKKLIISLLSFVLLLVVAWFLYQNFSAKVEKPDLLQVPTTQEEQSSPSNSSTESEATPPQPEPMQAPDFTVYNSDGQEVQLSDYFGKPIIVNFWASWCGPCKIEMPHFQQAYDTYGDDIEFLMVNMTGGQETRTTADRYIEGSGYTFPVYYDNDQNAAMVYQVMSIPTTLFIDKDGYIAAAAQTSMDEDMLAQGIDYALGTDSLTDEQ